MRWIGRKLETGVSLILEAGGVGTLSYEHHKIDEPAILLGGSFMAVQATSISIATRYTDNSLGIIS